MTTFCATSHPSRDGKRRLLSRFGEPLFFATWNRAAFIHYEVDPAVLQQQIPFELDLWNNRAYVSLVAFTLLQMRPRIGGRPGEWLFRPIASHEFLNLRTYVRQAGEPGIFFLAEWLSNPLSVRLGPRIFGLPYRPGRLRYLHRHERGEIQGQVIGETGRFEYRATVPDHRFEASAAGSATEFLLERYTAFTCLLERRRFFRIWHEPWPQNPIRIEIIADDLLAATGPWWSGAELAAANYSPGVEAWMGWPHRIVV